MEILRFPGSLGIGSSIRRPWGIMILHNINNNIPIPHLSYPGVYQDESKNENSTKR